MMMCHDSDLGNVSDWLKICFIHLEALPRSGEVTHHQYGISAVISWENHWLRQKMSAVFSGYLRDILSLKEHLVS